MNLESSNVPLSDRFEAMLAQERAERRRFEEGFLRRQPLQIPCPRHGHERPLDPEQSWLSTRQTGHDQAEYGACPECLEEEDHRRALATWTTRGVPARLVGATLDQLHYETVAGRKNLTLCRAFGSAPAGLLVLLGPPGVGKTHIAAALLQQAGHGLLISASAILEAFRHPWLDPPAERLLARAKAAALLVVDDLTLRLRQPGAADGFFELLDARYNDLRPMILTSNLSFDQLKLVLGPAASDRLAEAAYAVLPFHERSRRAEARTAYLRQAQQRFLFSSVSGSVRGG